MIIFKIKADKIEELFHFMNCFKDNELMKFQYGPIKEDNLPVLYFKLALIKKTTFLRRLRDFSKIHKNSIVAEEVIQNRFEEND
ncbi:hypothetical protein ACYE2N_00145 [Flavobacterium sp. MAHUQ-51]|uniref:hypothetical protein n=1 Tax=Flavobacterium sp. GCM10022190 TaxID=3252639 RepID=UPI00361BF754